MIKKIVILAVSLSICIGISGCAANKYSGSRKNTNIVAATERTDDEADFDEVEAKEIANGFALEYEGFDGTCTWLVLEASGATKEVLTIALSEASDDVKLSLLGSDGISKELSIGENEINLESGKYKINIEGNHSSNKIEMTFEKNNALNVQLSAYFNMGYNPNESASDDSFGNLFKNSINTDDIKSMADITDDMILNKEGAYFDHSEIGKKGECLTLDFEGFTGVYKCYDIQAKEKSYITVNIQGKIDKNLRVVLVQNQKTIQDIEDGQKIALDQGTYKIVLCGCKAKGKLNISLTYDKKTCSVLGS